MAERIFQGEIQISGFNLFDTAHNYPDFQKFVSEFKILLEAFRHLQENPQGRLQPNRMPVQQIDRTANVT
jgi:hypothetical protein